MMNQVSERKTGAHFCCVHTQLRCYFLLYVSLLSYLSMEGEILDINIKKTYVEQTARIKLESFMGKYQTLKLILEDWLTEKHRESC